MKKHNIRIPDHIAEQLGLTINSSKQYRLNDEDFKVARELKVSNKSTSKPNDYKKETFVLTAWSKDGQMMDIDDYCKEYNLPKKDISSYKLISHTGTPYYNIVFKENKIDNEIDFDFDEIISKHINPVKVDVQKSYSDVDFDMLTYSDVHIGMDTNSKGNSMYATLWNKDEALKSSTRMALDMIKNQKSDLLIVDDLGDFLDGYNGLTTRGGHSLPQNMTNEECFDTGVTFKMNLVDILVNYFKEIRFNNICNDNHSGAFGYFVNSAFKSLAEQKYSNVKVNNYRNFISHYFVNDVCFVITHGKDDSTLKFGFKPNLDTKQIEKIDQYIKRNDIYSKAKKIIFKKGDSHQTLFDMAGSDDFYYYNYPALSPSSQWVQNNFKKGRRGFVIESFIGIDNTIKPIFL